MNGKRTREFTMPKFVYPTFKRFFHRRIRYAHFTRFWAKVGVSV